MIADYLIVGQGIAGTFLAWQARRRGKSVMVIDRFNPNGSSNIATGVINPVTGRKLSKSWMIDTVLPFAKSAYRDIEQEFDIRILHDQPVYRLLSAEADVREWSDKRSSVDYQPYLGEIRHLDIPGLIQPFGAGEIRQGCWVNIPVLIRAFRKQLLESGSLIESDFDHADLQTNGDLLQYGNIRARHLICAEGYKGKQNPWFPEIPLSHAKGEQLEFEAPGWNCPHILNRNQFILPLGGDRYLTGSTFVWNDTEETVTEKGREELISKLRKMIDVPFTIVSEKAGIRPTITDRRPVLGASEHDRRMYIFNALGTKGISLAPYFSAHLLDHIETGKPLVEACAVDRFRKRSAN